MYVLLFKKNYKKSQMTLAITISIKIANNVFNNAILPWHSIKCREYQKKVGEFIKKKHKKYFFLFINNTKT